MKDDLISRQAVLDGLASIAKVKARSDAQKSLMGRVMFFVEQLPSIKPQIPLNVNEVLDKIINDIERKCCITVGRENDPAITLYDVFQIIDKYKIPLDTNKAKEFCGKDDCDKCKYLDGDLCRLVYQVKENLYEVMEDEV